MDDPGKHLCEGSKMKSIRKRLEDARKTSGLPWEIIEKDYILSWVLAGIAANKSLKNILIFKGGTALKKCFLVIIDFQRTLIFL
jgi:predicted nucleotidyltransferase component of viral defense system